MPNVPLPTGFNGLEDFPKLKENLINLFNPDSKIVSTPGISSFATGNGVARGAALFNDVPHYVGGNTISSYDSAGIRTDYGFIAGNNPVQMAAYFTQLAIIAGPGYVLDNVGTLTTITDGNYKPSRDVDVIDGVAIYIPSDGSPALYTDFGDFLTIAGFFDAEALPDQNRGVINVKGDLYIGGSDSIEVFNATGNADAPYRRNDGAAINVGYWSGKTLIGETWAFLGRLREGAYGFHIVQGGQAPDIASPEVSEILNEEYTPDELELCSGERIKWKGYEILVFRLSRHTFCYLNDRWFFLESGIAGAGVDNTWRGIYAVHAYGSYIIGDAISENIGKLTDTDNEYGQDIEREITTFARFNQGSYFNVDSVSLNCLVGTGSESDTIGLSMSENGQTWGPQLFESLGALGDYNLRVEWSGIPGGLGDYEDFAGMRFRITSNVEFGADALQFNGGQ